MPVSPAGARLTLVTGPLVAEAWQDFGGWASQAVRLWAASPDVELQWTVGPVPVEECVAGRQGKAKMGGGCECLAPKCVCWPRTFPPAPLRYSGTGKEVVSRLSTGWATGGVVYTDSNGREWQRRVRNARPDYNLTLTEPVAMNYYPVNTAARITGGGASLTLLTDRTQGGASLADGDVEVMVHRRLNADDLKGVFESLNELGMDGRGLIVRGTHRLQLRAADAPAARAHRAALQAVLLPPLLRGSLLPAGETPAAWAAALPPGAAAASALTAPLPANLFLLTLHARNASSLLLRLAHTFEEGEDPALSANVSASLAALFAPAFGAVSAAVELTLTSGLPLADVPPVTYSFLPTPGGQLQTATLPLVPPAPAGGGLTVGLSAMQIRTFMLTTSGRTGQ